MSTQSKQRSPRPSNESRLRLKSGVKAGPGGGGIVFNHGLRVNSEAAPVIAAPSWQPLERSEFECPCPHPSI